MAFELGSVLDVKAGIGAASLLATELDRSATLVIVDGMLVDAPGLGPLMDAGTVMAAARAIDEANALSGLDIVTIDPSVTTVTLTHVDGDLDITDPLIIVGNGATVDCGVLPIELIAFSAEPVGTFIDVNWSTATETDNERFIVQRSSDGIAFSPIGEVAGAGESFSRIDYRFTDTAPLPGTNYYRLQQVDTDGSSTTTTTVSANLRMSGQAALLFPNPATEQLQVSYFTSLPGMTHLQVVDASGRPVLRTDHAGNTGTQQVLLDVSGLDAGSYLLRISTGSGIPIENARFIKR